MRNLVAVVLTILSLSSLGGQALHDAVYRSITVKRPDARIIPQAVHLSQDGHARAFTRSFYSAGSHA
jgi:hypothetical protein